MSRPMLVLSVAFASYAVLSTAMSALAAAAWRFGWLDLARATAATRSRRLVLLRAFPSVAAACVTLGLVVPGFFAFELPHAYERVGPVLPLLALAGGALVGLAAWTALGMALATGRVERAWLRSASALVPEPALGVRAYVIDSAPPIVALVGVFSPKLIAAAAVVQACSREELAAIVAHERGHLRAHDNLKRWLMACAPDVFGWTRYHEEVTTAWHEAAEDAADDAATSGGVMARVDLATLLVKVARMSTATTWAPATVSPFVDADGLDRRVRRLLSDQPLAAPTTWALTFPVAGAAFGALIVAGLSSPAALAGIHELVETIVAFGR